VKFKTMNRLLKLINEKKEILESYLLPSDELLCEFKIMVGKAG
jgi:hypothetical protein